MRGGHLFEAELARDRSGAPLVSGEAVTMHEHDRDAVQAVVAPLLQALAQMSFVERQQDFALRIESFARLDDFRIEEFRQHDVTREELRAVLVTDAQRIAKSRCDDETGRLAAPLEQRVGRERGAHADAGDLRASFAAVPPQDAPDAFHARIAIVSRILGQQLERQERAARRARDHVGERAAAVDPELPARWSETIHAQRDTLRPAT